MLDKQYILDKMIKHFPRWMDIRKRVQTSNGGKMLVSVSEEIAFIQDAIDDYKKDFFIEEYHNRTEDILSLAQRAFVGPVELDVFSLVDPALKITTSLKDFYANNHLALYQNEYLYFKVDQVQADEIAYTLIDYTYRAKLELYHVWNVFDEFAAFVGLKRHEQETNQSLEKRILNVFRNRPNSSEQGLKNAILNELLTLVPDLTEDEIVIEGVTPENLKEQYDEFTTVIEKLAEVNKDVYRHKRWDVDVWNYPLKSIDYLPHFWDIALTYYQDGVGKKEDLKVALSTKNDQVDLKLNYYRKNIKKAEQYLEKTTIDTTVPLELINYKEDLVPQSTLLQIQASQLIDITNEGIAFECMSSADIEEEINLHELVDDSKELVNITVKDDRKLGHASRYKLQFCPTTLRSLYTIDQCQLIKQDGTSRTLLEESEYFVMQGNKLAYKHVRFSASELSDFSSTENAIKDKQGITVMPGRDRMTLKKYGANLAGGIVSLEYSCAKHPVDLKNNVTFSSDFVYTDGIFKKTTDNHNALLSVTTSCNEFSFAYSGEMSVQIEWGDGKKEDHMLSTRKGETLVFETKEDSLTPRTCHIAIRPMYSSSVVEISNIRVSVFDIAAEVEHGEVIIDGKDIILPDEYEDNVLTLTVFPKSQFAPYIHSLFCGTDPVLIAGERGYIHEVEFEGEAEDSLNIIAKSFTVTCLRLDASGNVVERINNYDPKKTYTANSGGGVVYLDLDTDYVLVNSITAAGVTYIETSTEKYLRIEAGYSISKVYLSALKATSHVNYNLKELFEVGVDEKLFVSNLFSGFAIKHNNGTQKFIKLSEVIDFSNAYEKGIFKYHNLPKELTPIYRESYQQRSNVGINIDKQTFHGNIKDSYLYIPAAEMHMAYNQHKLFGPTLETEIVDTFRPFLDKSLSYMYQIYNPNDNLEIHVNQVTETPQDLSIGTPRKLIIKWPYDANNKDIYAYDLLSLPVELKLNRVMKLSDSYKVQDKEDAKLSHYVLKAPVDYSVQYDTINPSVVSSMDRPDMYGSEHLIIGEQGFTKLEHCNVDRIVYIGRNPRYSESEDIILQSAYDLLKEEGIIVWKESESPVEEFYIQYTIKKPYAIVVENTDILYDKMPLDNLEAYDSAGSDELYNELSSGDFVSMNASDNYNKGYKMVAEFSAPNFEIVKDKEGKGFWVQRTIEENALVVKPGYYYIDGSEYYMLVDNKDKTTDKNNNVILDGVIKDKSQWILKQSSSNFVGNSVMGLGSYANVFKQDFVKTPTVSGSSALNAITACDSYNYWNVVGTKLSFTDGHNDVGLRLTPIASDGHILLKVTDKLFKQTRLSMHANGSIHAYLGTSAKSKDQLSLIDITNKEFEKLSGVKPILQYTLLEKDPELDYYLVVKGAGVIDDIVCADYDQTHGKWDYHSKNISTLGFEIFEHSTDDYVQRIKLTSRAGYLANGTEALADGTIINSPVVKWDYTKHTHYNTAEHWKNCAVNGLIVKDNLLVAENRDGTIETNSIYLGNLSVISEVRILINQVGFDQTTGLSTTVMNSANSSNFFVDYMPDVPHNEISLSPNVRNQDLKPYVKLKIKVPQGKMISDIQIFVKYKSTEESAPIETMSPNGTFVSEVYDAFFASHYVLDRVKIKHISNLQDVDLFVRGAKSNSTDVVWTDWKPVMLNDKHELLDSSRHMFKEYRYFQIKVALKTLDAHINIDSIDMKVVNS